MDPFEKVVAEHGPLVWQVCRALLSPTDADDAWSETFVAAMRAYPDLRPGSNVRGWLVTIAHHKAIDQIRTARRAPEPTAIVSDTESTEAIPEPPDADLRAALAALPEKQRYAVIYHHIAGLPYADIAELIDSSETAARRSAADGIAKLRNIYLEGTDR